MDGVGPHKLLGGCPRLDAPFDNTLSQLWWNLPNDVKKIVLYAAAQLEMLVVAREGPTDVTSCTLPSSCVLYCCAPLYDFQGLWR